MLRLIRDYQVGDEAAIVGLFQEVFGAEMTEAQWHWKYRGASPLVPLSKVAEDGNGAIIGHAGAVALRGRYQGHELPFYQICDVMVRRGARGHLGARNLFTLLLRGLLENLGNRHPEVFAYGFPGARPFLLGERAGVYDQIEHVRKLVWRAGARGHSWLNVSPLSWDDSALGRIWETWADAESGLHLIRDAAYLSWRYRDNPFRHYELLGIRALGRVLGWAVVSRHQAKRQIVDLLVPRRLRLAALRAVSRWSARDGGETLELWLPTAWRQNLPANPEPSLFVATNMVWHLPLTTDLVRSHLYYTMGDVDIF